MKESGKELFLLKGRQHYIFRYQSGGEEEVLNALVSMANEAQTDFDWFDAAVLSFQLSRNLVEEADALLCREAGGYKESSSSQAPGYNF